MTITIHGIQGGYSLIIRPSWVSTVYGSATVKAKTCISLVEVLRLIPSCSMFQHTMPKYYEHGELSKDIKQQKYIA
jgi:hypothetical protein